MGRNQFKKVRSRPLKSRRRKKYAKEKGCHSDVRCTPSARHAHFAAHHFSLKCAGNFSCFLSFMSLFQCFLASLHAMHTFFPMTYIHARGIYIFSYIRLKKRCAWCALTLNPLINQDLSCTLWPKMVCRIVCMVCRVVCTNDGTHKQAQHAKPMPHPFCTSAHIQPPPAGRPPLHRADARCT